MKRLLLLILATATFPAQADVYRCVGPDGSATFSQTPCSSTAERMAVHTGTASTGPTDCRYAEHFARSASRLMGQGFTKEDAIAEYGGSEVVGVGAQKILHYVYLYQRTRSVSHDRITALATAQCESGSFGDVSCEALPTLYIQAGGGCEGSFSAYRAEPYVDLQARHLAEVVERQQANAELNSQQSARMIADYEERERVRGCQAKIQHKINLIDARIRSGADPNGERLTLRRLRKSLIECR